MAFKLGSFLRRALNPLAPIQGGINAIKRRDLRGFAAATIPGMGATQSALRGDWKGAGMRMMNPAGEMAQGIDALSQGGGGEEAPSYDQQVAMKQARLAEQQGGGAAPAPVAAPAAAPPALPGGFMGGQGGGQGGGLAGGLRDIIQKQAMKRGGGISQLGG